MEDILKDKRILIVDDEPDILETLKELLDMCIIDTAPNFDLARKFLIENSYDAAILDIMGVKGYDLLDLSKEKEIPALMLTAHALSPDHLVKSVQRGAYSYIPKHQMADILGYLADVIQAFESGGPKPKKWFRKLIPFFDKKFGSDWRDKHKDFIRDFDLAPSREELQKIL